MYIVELHDGEAWSPMGIEVGCNGGIVQHWEHRADAETTRNRIPTPLSQSRVVELKPNGDRIEP